MRRRFIVKTSQTVPPKYLTFHHSYFFGRGGGAQGPSFGERQECGRTIRLLSTGDTNIQLFVGRFGGIPETQTKGDSTNETKGNQIIFTNNGPVFPSFVFMVVSQPFCHHRRILRIITGGYLGRFWLLCLGLASHARMPYYDSLCRRRPARTRCSIATWNQCRDLAILKHQCLKQG